MLYYQRKASFCMPLPSKWRWNEDIITNTHSNSLTHTWMTLNFDTHFTFPWQFFKCSKLKISTSSRICQWRLMMNFSILLSSYLLALSSGNNKTFIFIIYWLMNNIPLELRLQMVFSKCFSRMKWQMNKIYGWIELKLKKWWEKKKRNNDGNCDGKMENYYTFY